MKLTSKQIEQLEHIVYHLKRANDFIAKKDTIVGKKRSLSSTDGYTNKADDLAIYPIDKEIGSDLTGLSMGIDKLLLFINYNTK